MSIHLPILASVKSDWNVVTERPTVGKDVLELLSSSMYVNPLSIYREYVQNSMDSIEQARALGLLGNTDKGRIDISINASDRNVKIRDNGTGLAKSLFARTLLALGASEKRGTKARGFRGVGRLAGLGYCQELVFRSRADGENEVNELRWDCRRLKAILGDSSFKADIEDLIKHVVRTRHLAGRTLPGRFFEVELSGIVRHGNDCLINTEKIKSYLSQVAPVPFAPQFRFGGAIEAALRSKASLGDVLIFVNASEEPIYRPHQNKFEARKGVLDRFLDLELFDVKGSDDRPVATGWILHHGYRGAIDNHAGIKGLRLRSGNMQVGESILLDDLFAEPRFNSWVVGEIHVLDAKILPNGRRDHFEQSVRFNQMINKLNPTARDLTRRCRVSSLKRNLLREFEAANARVSESLSIIKHGSISSSESKRLYSEIHKDLKRMTKVCSNAALVSRSRTALEARLQSMVKAVNKLVQKSRRNPLLNKVKPERREAYEQIFSLIYQCSPSATAAKRLIDRILERLK